MSKKKLNTRDLTVPDIDNLINNVFPFHITLLAEATIGNFMNFMLETRSVKIVDYTKYHTALYFQQMNIQIYKLILDNQGNDTLTVPKLIGLLIDKGYQPNNKDKLIELRKKFNIEIINKYPKALSVIRKFRHTNFAHILVFPIEDKQGLKNDSNDISPDLIPIVQNTINLYLELLEILGYKNNLDIYSDLDKVINERMKIFVR